MKPSEVASMLECCVDVKMPACIWGSPGIGKSDVVRQTGLKLQRRVIDVRASLLDAVDLRGIPSIQNGRTTWCTPDFLPDGTGGPSILFLDELNRAPTMVQNALLQLTLDRKLGEYSLPGNCEVVAACNEAGHGGGIQKMPQAQMNRFEHIEMEHDTDDWSRWAVQNGMEPAVIAFVRFRPELLNQFSLKDRAFPTPRSWSFVSKITAKKPGNGIEHALYRGAVGTAAADEYSAFLRMFRELPNIDAILLSPGTAAIPTQPATIFAVVSALSRRVTFANIARIFQYFARLPQEYGVFGVQDAVRRDDNLKSTPDFTRWAIDNAGVTF